MIVASQFLKTVNGINSNTMKQYTTPEQTAKLIELGLVPKRIQSVSDEGKMLLELMGFSIGELIEMLPEYSSIYDLTNMHTMKRCWYVGHISTLNVSADELIDALYDMVVKLKEEGVI